MVSQLIISRDDGRDEDEIGGDRGAVDSVVVAPFGGVACEILRVDRHVYRSLRLDGRVRLVRRRFGRRQTEVADVVRRQFHADHQTMRTIRMRKSPAIGWMMKR